MTSTSTTTSTARTPAARRRSLLAAPSIVVAPGVFDGISACMALKAGHKAPYQTGAGTSASHLARADLGFLGMSDMIGAAGVSIMADPSMLTTVIADADTGFGGAPQVNITEPASPLCTLKTKSSPNDADTWTRNRSSRASSSSLASLPPSTHVIASPAAPPIAFSSSPAQTLLPLKASTKLSNVYALHTPQALAWASSKACVPTPRCRPPWLSFLTFPCSPIVSLVVKARCGRQGRRRSWVLSWRSSPVRAFFPLQRRCSRAMLIWPMQGLESKQRRRAGRGR